MNVCIKLLNGDLLTVSIDDPVDPMYSISTAMAKQFGCPPSCVAVAYDTETDMYLAFRNVSDVYIRIHQETLRRTPFGILVASDSADVSDSSDELKCYSIFIEPYGEYIWVMYHPYLKQFAVASDDPSDALVWTPTLREALWLYKDTGVFRYPSLLTEYVDSMDHRFAMLHLLYEMRGHYYTASLYRWRRGPLAPEFDLARPALPPVFFCDTLHESANNWLRRT